MVSLVLSVMKILSNIKNNIIVEMTIIKKKFRQKEIRVYI